MENSFIMKNEQNFSELKIELYDPDTKQFKKPISAPINYYIALNNNKEIISHENHSDLDLEKETFLCHSYIINDIIIINNIFSLENEYQFIELIDNLDNYFWYVVESNKKEKNFTNNKLYLTQGDIIKFGNCKFLVKNLCIKNDTTRNNINELITYSNLNFGEKPYIKEDIKNYKKCRFCDYAYYINLCTCEKKLFHNSCFKKSNNKNTKTLQNTEYIKSYYIPNFYCKECKCLFSIQYSLQNENNNIDLVDIPTPDNDNYLILETIGREDKYFHIINLDINKDKILIGKNDSNDVVIKDDTVEEVHAMIKIDEIGGVFLENCTDKFNSFILIRKKINLINNKKILLKVKDVVFRIRGTNHNIDSDDENDSE